MYARNRMDQWTAILLGLFGFFLVLGFMFVGLIPSWFFLAPTVAILLVLLMIVAVRVRAPRR